MSSTQTKKRKKAFTPSPTQEKFLKDTSDQILLSGSFGAGKSRIGCEKGYLLNLKYPGNRGLIVRRVFGDVRDTTIEQTLLEEVIPESHIADHNKSQHVIKHFTGHQDENGGPVLSEIHYHGLDSGRSARGDGVSLPRKIGSGQYAWIFVDEGIEISQAAWVQLNGRLRYRGKEQAGNYYTVPFRQIFTATNPASKSHWMYQWFFVDGKGNAYTMTAEELAKHVDSVPDDYVQRMEENFTGVFYKRYVKGQWVAAEGVVYEEYDPELHLRDAEDLPGDWRVSGTQMRSDGYETVWAYPPDDWSVYRVVDFGYNNPLVCQWWAYDTDMPRAVMFREIYKTEQLVEDVAAEILAASDRLLIANSLADPAQAEDRATLERHGVYTDNAEKDVFTGILETKQKLNSRTEDGNPRLMFMKGSRIHEPDERLVDKGHPTHTVEEITEYQWKDGTDKPEEKHDHGMDCMRYFVKTVMSKVVLSEDELQEYETLFNQRQTGGNFQGMMTGIKDRDRDRSPKQLEW